MGVQNHAAARGTQHVGHAGHAGHARAHAAPGATNTGKTAAAGGAAAPTGFAAMLSANSGDTGNTGNTGAGDTADVAAITSVEGGATGTAGAGTAAAKRLGPGAASVKHAGSHGKTATTAAGTGLPLARTPTDTVAGSGGKSGKAGKTADGPDDSASGDAATLAAWAGLLQSQATPASASLAPAGQASGTSVATGTGAPVATTAGASQDTNTAPISSGPQGRAGARSTQGLAIASGAPGAIAPTVTPGAAAPIARPGENAMASAGTTPTGESPAAGAAPSAVVQQTFGDGAAAPTAPASPTPGTVPGQWRAANASTQAVLGRAHIAATAAATAAGSGQASGLSASAITIDAVDAGAGRGAASTVSLGDGGQGRWAGMLSEIARPMAGEAGAGGMSDGASAGRENAHDTRGADTTGSGSAGFAALGAGGETTGPGFAQTAGGAASEAQPTAGGMVMTPDEWLAATTASINPRALQTAELTVDAFGSPVDVKISLSGADAQVSFQTDQADTRALLGSAVSDLQNRLQQEGLVLSGVSVGGSGAGAAGQAAGHSSGFHGDNGNRSRSADSLRGFTPDIAVASATAASSRSAEASARGGLDLFA